MRDDFNDLLQRLLQRFPDSFGARAADIRQRHWQAEQILEAVLPELQVSPSQRSRIGGHLFKGHKVFANEVQAAIGRCPDAFAKLSLATPAVATHLARAGAYQALGGFLGRLHRRAADHQQLEMACAVRIALEVHEEVKAQARCRQPSAEARRGMQATSSPKAVSARPGSSATAATAPFAIMASRSKEVSRRGRGTRNLAQCRRSLATRRAIFAVGTSSGPSMACGVPSEMSRPGRGWVPLNEQAPQRSPLHTRQMR